MPQGRNIAIGDIHGCTTALAALVQALEPQQQDKLILLGDYIDRGPDSRGTLDFLMDLARRCWLVPLMGNHEKILLSILAGKDYMMENWMGLGGGATLQSFNANGPENIGEHYIAFMRNCVRSHETPGHLLLHANYLPNLPLEQQPQYVIRWQSLRHRTPPPHYSGKKAVVGHTAQKTGEVLDLGHLMCIDTYCYGGGWLTALDLDTGDLLQASQNRQVRRLYRRNGSRAVQRG